MKIATLLVLGVAAFLATAPVVRAQEVTPPKPVTPSAVDSGTAWLGVATWPVSPAMAKELKLTEGFHLTVLEVGVDSPAAKAGLKSGDILLRLDDQILVNPAQLRSLIQSRKPGENVKVTYLRAGAQHSPTVSLGVKVSGVTDASGNSPTPVDIMKMLSRSSGLPDIEDHMRILAIEDSLAGGESPLPGYATVARSDESGTIHLSRNESGTNLRCVDAKGNVIYQGPVNTPEERAKVPADWLAKADGLGAGIKVVTKAPLRRRVILPGSSTPSLSFQNTDDSGTVTLTLNQGSKIIRCADPMGKILFEGPINTAEERAQVPPEWLRRADLLNAPIPSQSGPEASRRIVNSPGEQVQQPVPHKLATATTFSDTSDGFSVTVRHENGSRTLRATDASGAVIFDGPIDTPAQRAHLPEKLRLRFGETEQGQPGPALPTMPEVK